MPTVPCGEWVSCLILANGTVTIPAFLRKKAGKEIGEYIDIVVPEIECPATMKEAK